MKKLLLTLFIGVSALAQLSAQCTPDTTISNVVEPPTGTKYDTVNGTPIAILPYAQSGQPYSETIHFKVPDDTTFANQTVQINFIQLDSVLGIPPNFVLSCNTSDCKFLGGDFGCGTLNGTAGAPDSVEMRIAITYEIVFGTNTAPIKDTLGGYYLVTKGQPIGLEESKLAKNDAPRIYPNPADNVAFLKYSTENAQNVNLKISSVIGTLVYNKSFESQPGENKLEINTNQFKQGIYMYSIKVNGKSYAGRFTVSH